MTRSHAGRHRRTRQPRGPLSWLARAWARSPALKSIFSMASLSVTQTACNALIALIGTISLGAAGRGVMVVGITLGSFMAFAGGLGTGPAMRSRYPATSGPDRARLVSAYSWWTATGALVAPLVTAAAAAASAPFIDPTLATPSFLVAVGVYTATQLVVNQFVEAWYAEGRYAFAMGSAAAMAAVSLAAVLVSLKIARTPAGLLLAQGLGTTVVCVFVGLRQRAAGLIRFHRPTRADTASLLRVGCPALGVNAGLAIVLRADRYLLGVFSGPAAVGIYSLAASLSEIPRVVPTASGQVLMREVSLGRGAGAAPRLLRTAFLVTTVSGVVIGCAGWVLIPRVFGTEFVAARGLLLILLVAEMSFAPYAIASRGLLGGAWTVAAGSVGMGGAAFGVACYALTIGVGGARGAAVGSILVYGGLSAASWALLRRRLRPRPADAEPPVAATAVPDAALPDSARAAS